MVVLDSLRMRTVADASQRMRPSAGRADGRAAHLRHVRESVDCDADVMSRKRQLLYCHQSCGHAAKTVGLGFLVLVEGRVRSLTCMWSDLSTHNHTDRTITLKALGIGRSASIYELQGGAAAAAAAAGSPVPKSAQ